MDHHYYFSIKNVEFILVREYSSIGACYPMLFVHNKTADDYCALDIYLDRMVNLDRKAWNVYYCDIDVLVNVKVISAILDEVHVSYKKLKDCVDSL